MSAFRNSEISSLQSRAVTALSSGDDATALALYRAAARREPKNPMHALRAGDCLVRLGRIQEALPVYRNVAERYAADGQHARAVSVYRLVQRLAPRDVPAAQRLAELKALRHQPPAPPKVRELTAAEVAEMFPVVELDVTPVSIPCEAAAPELGPLWDDVTPAPVPVPLADVAALEATVRDLLAELLRTQCELDALRAAASAEAVISAC